MAKQRRASSRSGRPKPARRVGLLETPAAPAGRESQARTTPPPHPFRAPDTSKRSRYTKRASRHCRRTNSPARPRFCDPCCPAIRRNELHERVRLYLNVCERQWRRAPRHRQRPRNGIRRNARVNAGNYNEALEHCGRQLESPDHDHALYMLAAVLACAMSRWAVPLLLRAIELNPDNRRSPATIPT